MFYLWSLRIWREMDFRWSPLKSCLWKSPVQYECCYLTSAVFFLIFSLQVSTGLLGRILYRATPLSFGRYTDRLLKKTIPSRITVLSFMFQQTKALGHVQVNTGVAGCVICESVTPKWLTQKQSLIYCWHSSKNMGENALCSAWTNLSKIF